MYRNEFFRCYKKAYWQAKEIHRVIQTHTLPDPINLDLLSNISPVSWENIILYGDYILNRNKVVL